MYKCDLSLILSKGLKNLTTPDMYSVAVHHKV